LQPGQPLAAEPVDLLAGQPVADPLDGGRVADRAERVVQAGERDTFFDALLLGVLVAVEVDLQNYRRRFRHAELGNMRRQPRFAPRMGQEVFKMDIN